MSTEWIDEVGNEHDHEIQRMDGFDDCVVGLIERFGMEPILVYDKGKIIAKMMNDGMTPTEAHEYFDFNMIGSWTGDGTPAYLTATPPDEP